MPLPGNMREEPPGYILVVLSWLVSFAPPEGVFEKEEGGRPQFEGSRSSGGRTSQPSSPMTGRMVRGGEEVARRRGDLRRNEDPERMNGGEGDGSES